ncbi:MAG: chemotaxis protein CheA [candidate division Zixibacteria bacterium]|nr:chemotaxis protein CheA [candidate division Zixibacteria bacterium]
MTSTDSAIIEFDEMQEIIDDFMLEADELVNSLDTNLVKLEDHPEDLDLLNEIFRAAHTIKGTSGFLGLDDITSLTHKMEDVLNRLRKETLKVTPHIMDVLLESVDSLKVLLEDVSEQRKVERDYSKLKARLAALTGDMESGSVDPAVGSTEEPPAEGSGEPELPSIEEIKAQLEKEAQEADAIDQAQSDAQETTQEAENNTAQSTKLQKSKETIRVDVSRLDNLMNLMGELVLGRNSLLQSTNKFTKQHEDMAGLDDLNRSGTQINFITTEIQLAIMKMRMLPVGKVFSKFPRMVRDLSRESGKDIALELFGEDTELDKSVIEAIGDPLVHLIRNSCDHGIEPKTDRKLAGKPEGGTVRLGASQEGSNIVIAIEDDGKGLDVEAIKAKAVSRGLATQDEINRMSHKEVFRFIFQAGFSTAKVVTDVSGRGVGMDVVKTNIEKLKGIIEIESEIGKGTTIHIKLPLTLAILQGLLIVSEGETYVVPLASVLETLRISTNEIDSVNGRDVITLRDGVLPIVNLNSILKGRYESGFSCEKPYVVVVGLGEKRLGLIVDGLLGQEEVVIKSMGHMLGETKGLAGATILGDGRVRLIVDLIGLFKLAVC